MKIIQIFFYKLIKELYINLSRYEKKSLWNSDKIDKNRIDDNKSTDEYNGSEHFDEFNNCFIKFI